MNELQDLLRGEDIVAFVDGSVSLFPNFFFFFFFFL